MSKIKTITVSNLKAVSALTADFNGMTAIITGGNNKGKSSFLRSLPDRLRGCKPDLVLKHGEKDGMAEIELTTGEKILWTFDNKGKDKIIFTSERNLKQSITKEISAYYFPPVFDVDTFLTSGPKKQKEVLQKLSGIDFTEAEKLYKAAYENRTWANKLVVTEKAKLLTYDPEMNMQTVDVTSLQTELNSIEAHNLRHKNVVDGRAMRIQQKDSNVEEINQLEAKIREIQAKNIAIGDEIIKADEWLSVEKNLAKNNAAELQAKINEAAEKNKAINDNAIALKQQQVYEKAVADAAAVDAEVKQLEADKAEALRCSSLPDGFGFNDDGITYKDLPFTRENLSSSAIYIAALKLAAIGLGEVKTLHFDASFLDKNSLSEIEKWANGNELQLLIERPDYEGGEIEYHILQKTETAA